MPSPLATLAATVDSAGISAPSFAEILQSLQLSFQQIYGQDVYLGNDTQDGQLLATVAKAISDCNAVSIAVYNQFNPSFAQGAGLSNLVRLNGIARLVATNSQVDLLIGGDVGVTITGGVAGDLNGASWALPDTVVIPPAGSILVTATAVNPGSIAAAINTIQTINTPVLGWRTVTNPSVASLGAAVETDAELRLRQAQSVALPSLSILAGTLAAVEDLPGVTEAVIYENDTGVTDSNGLPPHSISLVVNGGDSDLIAKTIMVKKTPGCYTYGSTTVLVDDSAGVTHAIRYFVPASTPISVAVTVKALKGYTSATGDAIKQAIVDYINDTLSIGEPVFLSRLYLPAQLNGAGAFGQYEVLALLCSAKPGAVAAADVPIAFNAQATCQVSDVALTVT